MSLPIGTLAFSGFGDSDMEFRAADGSVVSAPAGARIGDTTGITGGTNGCGGIVSISITKYFVSGTSYNEFPDQIVEAIIDTDFLGYAIAVPNSAPPYVSVGPTSGAAVDASGNAYWMAEGTGSEPRSLIRKTTPLGVVTNVGTAIASVSAPNVKLGVSPDGTIAYWANYQSSAIKRHDLVNDVPLSDLATVTGGSGNQLFSLLVLPDGNILVGWASDNSAGAPTLYDPSGSVLHSYTGLPDTYDTATWITYAVDPATGDLVSDRFLIAYYSSAPGYGVTVAEVETATGTVLNTFQTPNGFEWDGPFVVTREGAIPPPEPVYEDLCTTTQEPVLMVSVAPPGQDIEWFSQTDLPHDTSYYGGFKPDRVLAVSEVKRSLAGAALDYQVGTFNVEFADEDYAIREMLTASQGQFFSRWEIDAYMATPSGMNARVTALHIATGLVDTDPEFDSRPEAMTVRMSCRDRLGVAMGWTLTDQTKLPRRVISNTTLPGVGTVMNGKSGWLPWGVLTNNYVAPSGLTPPLPNGIAARGSTLAGPYWTAGYAPWDQTIAPVTGLVLTAVAGGDCPERDFAIQVFPVDANDNVGDPTPYILGDMLVTSATPDRTMRADWVASPNAVKYYVVMSANYFGWLRPQQILETTGTFVEFNHAPDFPATGALATGAVPPPIWIYNYYTARSKDGLFTSLWHTEYDPVLYPAQFAISFGLPNGKTRPVRLYWDPTGAPSYQVRKTAAGPGFTPRIFDVLPSSLESGLLYWDDDWNDADALPIPDPNLRASGRVKVEYSRDVELADGQIYHELFIAGCPIKGVDNWLYDPGGDPSNVEMNQNDGTVFLFPKSGTAWDGVNPTRYRDIQGTDGITRRYTMGYALAGTAKGDLVASGISIVTVDLQGIEDVGDGSGAVITDLHDQLVHFLNYFVVASGEGYTSGLWGTAPTQGYDDLPIVNTTSFDEVKAMREAELAGGIVGAGITGAHGEFVNVSDELKRWMVSGDFRLGPNRDWQIVCRALDTSLSPLFISNILTDKYDIQNRTFKPTPRLSELQNIFKYRSSRDYVNEGWLVDDQDYVNQDSIDNWRIRKQGEDLNFNYIEDALVVGHILGKHTSRRADAPMYATFEGGLCQVSDEYDIGKYFNLTHWRGVGVGGWEDRAMWIISSALNPDTKRVRLECLDVTELISSNNGLLEGLVDIQLGGSWYNSPTVGGTPATVDAYEYWEMRFPWSAFPTGTTLTARMWAATVPSGVTVSLELYDVDNAVVVATDPTPFVGPITSFTLHTFQMPTSLVDVTYRLRAVVTGGSGQSVMFKGMLRPNLP